MRFLKVVLLSLVLVTNCYSKDPELKVPARDVSTQYGSLHLSELVLAHEHSEWRLISGSITNNTGRNWGVIFLKLRFSDKKGNPINNVTESVAVIGLRKGETKRLWDEVLEKATSVDDILIKGSPARFDLEFDQSGSHLDLHYVFTLASPVIAKELSYSDDSLSVRFNENPFSSLSFVIANKTPGPISILWDKASFIDPLGTSHRVFHKGTKIVDRDRPQGETTIPPNARWEDEILPTDYITWSELTTDWNYQPLLPLPHRGAGLKGQAMGLFLPIEIGGKQTNYSFRIKIEDVVENTD